MKVSQIVFTGINKAELIKKELPPMGTHDVRVRTAVSTISAGTERANITGDPNVNPISCDYELSLYRTLMECCR